MKKLAFVASLAVFAVSAHAADDAIIAKYNKSCMACHATGAAGAPKSHVEADWTARMEKGMETMVAHVTNGLNAMPPKGMCYDCSPEDYQALIEFMANPQ
jgi:cytochrome c5